MLEATRLTRAGRLSQATALLQRMLRGYGTPDTPSGSGDAAADAPARPSSTIIDVVPDTIEVTDPEKSPRLGRGFSSEGTEAGGAAGRHLPGALRGFVDRISRIGGELGNRWHVPPAPAPGVVPDGGQFLTGSYSNQAGSRPYKLYVPSGYHGQALPLIVMLHGCTQSPDDFAAGTGMNALAEERTCLVVYPVQTSGANASKCWNWFSPTDQRRDQGEPSLIAGITRQVMGDYAVDPRRVYVAGLSAGGAAAAIMGTTYPDLYAAIGVHSGLACGAAHDMPSAFAVMRQGDAGAGVAKGLEENRRPIPAIVFHGDRDTTVHPRNGDHVVAQSRSGTAADLEATMQRGQVPGGHAYSRTVYGDASDRAILEHWVIHGAGHAWSGGSPVGSYTDPRGPDATREMLRFFLDHPHPPVS
jgi:poly(hydroxyalkanoate) depolymerase family esterase